MPSNAPSFLKTQIYETAPIENILNATGHTGRSHGGKITLTTKANPNQCKGEETDEYYKGSSRVNGYSVTSWAPAGVSVSERSIELRSDYFIDYNYGAGNYDYYVVWSKTVNSDFNNVTIVGKGERTRSGYRTYLLKRNSGYYYKGGQRHFRL